jgi:hypothetical protein
MISWLGGSLWAVIGPAGYFENVPAKLALRRDRWRFTPSLTACRKRRPCPRVIRTGWFIMPSIFCGVMPISEPPADRAQAGAVRENDIGLPNIYSEHLIGAGQEMFEHAAKLNFEGIVSKNAQAPYRSDRNEGWLKIKTVPKGQFPVIGFVKDPTGVAALYLGKREGKDLVYMGKVGTAGLGRYRAKSGNSLIRS